MWLKYISVTILFFILALVQTSFLPYVGIMGTVPNVIFILLFIMLFFEKQVSFAQHYQGIFFVIAIGFILDIFSPFYIGVNIFSLLLVYFLVKTTFHFLEKQPDSFMVHYFLPLFLLCDTLYNGSVYFLTHFSHPIINFNENILIALAYNLILATIIFYAYGFVKHYHKKDRQLRLF